MGQADLAAGGLRGVRGGEVAAGAPTWPGSPVGSHAMPVFISPQEQRGSGVSLAVWLSAVIDPPGRGGIQPHRVPSNSALWDTRQQDTYQNRLRPSHLCTQVGVATASLGGVNWVMGLV